LGTGRCRSFVPDGCTLLCGPQYALLRREFVEVATNLRRRDGTVRRVLIFFGGIDRSGQTLKACRAILKYRLSGQGIDRYRLGSVSSRIAVGQSHVALGDSIPLV